MILAAVLEGLGDIWPGRITLAGENLGDVGRHPAAATGGLTSGLVPFHKLSQWLAYSLIEPLEAAGIEVTGLDDLTALAEYRNGGLLIDLGVLRPRHDAVLGEAHAGGSEVVVEWRALTVALIDRLAERIRAKLDLTSEQLPLAKVLEGGTWAAGRKAARELRPGGGPPLRLIERRHLVLTLPALVGHADWSVDPGKRWLALATRQAGGRYHARAPQPVGPLESLWARLGDEAGGGHVLLGVDFPIGLPAAYAALAGISDFRAALEGFDDRFYAVAERPEEIDLGKPFYPMRPGGRRRQQLLDGLGLASWSDLLRRCDRRSPTRSAAGAIFWTQGAQQVGKAAITGWRDLLAPALRAGFDLALWPFQGKLDDLLTRHRIVVAETYPAEVYRHLGLDLRGGKRRPAVRRSNAAGLLAWATSAAFEPDPALVAGIEDGFGSDLCGEDRFDAVVGLFGMLGVVLGRRLSGEPDEPLVRQIEGWILGQTAT